MKSEEMVNRKLIRPNLSEIKRDHSSKSSGYSRGRKQAPPEQTFAETFYYQKQMNSRTPMVVVMNDGEELVGVIEWYDRNCIKLNRDDQPNLMIFKHGVRYLYKHGDKE